MNTIHIIIFTPHNLIFRIIITADCWAVVNLNIITLYYSNLTRIWYITIIYNDIS